MSQQPILICPHFVLVKYLRSPSICEIRHTTIFGRSVNSSSRAKGLYRQLGLSGRCLAGKLLRLGRFREELIMITKTKVALVVALAVGLAPSAMAHSRTHQLHAHHVTHPSGYGSRPYGYDYDSAYPDGGTYQWSPNPGYRPPLPAYTRGWNCVTDEGQGRFLPCEMGGD
jgi:hypothetical protein